MCKQKREKVSCESQEVKWVKITNNTENKLCSVGTCTAKARYDDIDDVVVVGFFAGSQFSSKQTNRFK